MRRLPTGVSILDEALEGGVPAGAWVVVSGEPGTGKTVLTQTMASTAIKHGYRIVVISTEMTLHEWRAQAESLNLSVDGIVRLRNAGNKAVGVFTDIYDLIEVAKELKEKAGKWIPYLSPSVLNNIARRAVLAVSDIGRWGPLEPVLLIIDSISLFYLQAPNTAGKVVLDLMRVLGKSENLNVVMTVQYAFTTGGSFGARAEHVADGVIHLWMDSVEKVKEVRRYLIIKKMRATNHSLKAFRVSIKPGEGIVLEPVK